MRLGERLREIRNSKNLTQAKLANMIHSSAVNISKYERGITEPSVETLRLLTIALDTTADYLIGVSEKTKKSSVYTALFEKTEDFSEEEIKKLLEYAAFLEAGRK